LNSEEPISETPTSPEPQPEVVVEPPKNEYYEKYLRALADYQNYQKRTRFEADRAKEETLRSLILDFIPIYDNFGLIARQYSTDVTFVAVKDQFTSFLAKYGIQKIPVAPAALYDSTIHEALVCREQDGAIEMTVEQIFRPGFTLNGKVLRPVQVGINKPKN
jgi:molecular chaperone GrpE